MTIYWLMESVGAHSDLAKGIPPEGMLNDEEMERFSALRVPKRRRDWLIGRWTIKRVLRAMLNLGKHEPTPAVLNDDDHAPYVKGIPDLSISISHSGDFAFCAAAWGVTVGADLEGIAPRSWDFVQDYFTHHEIGTIQRVVLPRDMHSGELHTAPDLCATLLWSAKEAALKALHLGLSVDTRAVEISLTPHDDAYQDGELSRRLLVPHRAVSPNGQIWLPFTADARARGLGGVMPGWWRMMHGFALTLAYAE